MLTGADVASTSTFLQSGLVMPEDNQFHIAQEQMVDHLRDLRRRAQAKLIVALLESVIPAVDMTRM